MALIAIIDKENATYNQPLINTLNPLTISTNNLAVATFQANTQIEPAAIKPLNISLSLCSQRTTGLWECLSVTPSLEGGSISKFRFKLSLLESDLEDTLRKVTEYNDSKEVFPAPEYAPTGAIGPHDSQGQHQLRRIFPGFNEDFYQFLETLGYDCSIENGELYFSVPDKEALIAQLNRQQIQLEICDSNDEATDEEFRAAFYKYDALLSRGKLHKHDQGFHIIPLLYSIYSNPNDYLRRKELLRTAVKNHLEIPIQWAKTHHPELSQSLLHGTLAFYIDVFSAFNVNQLEFLEAPLELQYFIRLALWLFENQTLQRDQDYLNDRFKPLQVKETFCRMLCFYYGDQAGYTPEQMSAYISRLEKVTDIVDITTKTFILYLGKQQELRLKLPRTDQSA